MISIIEFNDIISDINPHKVFRICSDEKIQTSDDGEIEIDGTYILDVVDTNYTKEEILQYFIDGLYNETYKSFTYIKSEYTKGEDSVCRKILQIEREYKLKLLCG